MSGMTRRMLLGGLFASIALPALARDDDMRPVGGPRRMRWGYGAPRRHYRGYLPPENQANLGYQGHNKVLSHAPESARRVVMMGDSITYAWGRMQGAFFEQHGIVDRGIGGETSGQMLLRFSSDVLSLKPEVVHIMAGTNDIAAWRRPYNADLTRQNIQAMAEQAKDNGIIVILASVPPITNWVRRNPGDRVNTLRSLNDWIKDLCDKGDYTYCDYWPAMSGPGGRMKPGYARDGVHPTLAGYAAMNPVLLAAIDTALSKKRAG